MSEAAIQTYMSKKAGPLPFCPGCGHDRLLKELDRALLKLQLDPREVVIVTDIGCIGLADTYFVTNAFHGLHGRSLTYATGIKLARPELKVIVLMGDGGCGIGGAHLLSASRRNLDITLIVANNFNYGMTGGQSSVTTPTGSRTATAPGGSLEGPMDLCATTAAAGASWVYRGMTHDADLADRIVEGIRHPGFALLDVWELCTAYYTVRNDMNKRELIALVERTGMRTGIIADIKRPEFGASVRAVKASKRQNAIFSKSFESELDHQIGIVLAGGAGQKVKTAATTLARAGILSGLDATQKDDYPITVMTGHSVSEINLSPKSIAYTNIDSPDYFVVISEDGLKKTRKWIERLPASCTLYADDTLQLPETQAKIKKLPLSRNVKEIGRLSVTIAAIGAIVADGKFIPSDALEQAIVAFQSASVAETNVKALRVGARMASGSV